MRTPQIPALILIILLSVTFFGCESKKTTDIPRSSKGTVQLGGSISIPVDRIPQQLSPSSLSDRPSSAIGVHLHEGLVRLDANSSNLIPGLAETWSKEQDGASYVFNLRKGVVFHNSDWFGNGSREVTAKDVAYSLSVLARDASDELFQATIGGRVLGAESHRSGESVDFEGVEVVDDYTLRLKLVKPSESFLQILALPAFGVIPQSSTEGENSANIGAGPFTVADGEGGLTLVRNPEYFREDEFGNNLPYLDTLRFIAIQQNTDKLDAFFKGQIDLVSGLELDPVRDVLEQHVADFSGKAPRYIMKREVDNASYDTYSIYQSKLKGLGSGFMGYRDFSRTQIEQ